MRDVSRPVDREWVNIERARARLPLLIQFAQDIMQLDELAGETTGVPEPPFINYIPR
ncbi:hypothetical protein [Natronocalculus amylovorans]|uniref:Uncharacterized protein n=1 Tax=Natronocalculus amylovorans TaxID=2917812 RepID=A0AAE3KC55_9EURY|nr:hypothetical protein [Natronocalculus amylovorans]MCL9817724.1 hypothetical protein [Natronocalculus amylovorans]